VAVAVISALALAATAAATRTLRIASHISIKSKALTFSGHVTSPNAACEASRHVTLYRKFSDGTHQALGSTTTGPSGKWKVTASGSAGISLSHFYATVRRRSEGTAGTIYVCKAARSRTIAFH
jgi:hypothetical protein